MEKNNRLMNWKIFDRFYNAHWFLTGYSCRNFSELLRAGESRSITEFIGVMKNDVNLMIFDKGQFDKAGHYYANKIINDNKWRNRMYKKHAYYTKRFFRAGEEFRRLKFSEMNSKRLLKKIDKLIPLQEQVRVLGVVLNGLVLDGRNHLSNKLRNELKTYIGSRDFEKNWSLLTQVTKPSMRQKNDIAIAKLAAVSNKLNKKQVQKKLRQIYKESCWLDYMYYGPPTSLKRLKNEYKTALKNNINIDLAKKLELLTKQQNRLMKKEKLNARARHLIKMAQLILWQKGWRKDVEYHGFYCYEPFFKEIAKKKKN